MQKARKPESRRQPVPPFQTSKSQERLNKALALAIKLHGRQTRKQIPVPYISHLWAVASLVLEFGGSEDQAIAALLHDAAEDQGGTATLARIRREFGPEVARIVAGCSDSVLEQGARKAPWRARKQRYLAHLSQADRAIALVAAADKLHNISCTLRDFAHVGRSVWKRFNRGQDEQFWYYRGCVSSLKQSLDGPLVAELDWQVDQLARLAKAA